MDVVIVGAGGSGRECAQFVCDIEAAGGELRLRGFLDDDQAAEGDETLNAPLLGPVNGHDVSPDTGYLVAVGHGPTRAALALEIERRGGRLVGLIHPKACVSRSAKLGRHVVLAPFAYIGPRAVVGDHAQLNVYASVSHDARVGDRCTLSPYATLNGHAVVESDVFMGTRATVTVGCVIGEGSRVGAGAVVLQDMPARSLVVGMPARHRSRKETSI